MKRTTIIAGIAGISLLAILFAFKTISEKKSQINAEPITGRETIAAQKVNYDLGKLLAQNKLITVNREVSASPDKTYSAVKVHEKEGEGVVWLKEVNFSKGTIDLDLKGKDVLQKSFIGVAFHGVDDKTFDGIYFRPFNFKTSDPVRHIHAVQYISHPDFPWKKLRDEKNGLYEKAVTPEPDPNNWFHARLEVDDKEVKVFVNNSTKPSLVVNKLNNRTIGTIGLWTGEGSGGEFANLTIVSND
jgi:hypothetical protein